MHSILEGVGRLASLRGHNESFHIRKHSKKNIYTDPLSWRTPSSLCLACGGRGGAAAVVAAAHSNVELLIDDFGHGSNHRAEFAFDLTEKLLVFFRDETDGETEMAVAARAADAVEIRLGVARKIEVDHHVDRLNVYASSKEI